MNLLKLNYVVGIEVIALADDIMIIQRGGGASELKLEMFDGLKIIYWSKCKKKSYSILRNRTLCTFQDREEK